MRLCGSGAQQATLRPFLLRADRQVLGRGKIKTGRSSMDVADESDLSLTGGSGLATSKHESQVCFECFVLALVRSSGRDE